MEVHGERDERSIGGKLNHELVVDLALSAESTALWRVDFSDGTITWMHGLGEVLGMPDAADHEIRARLAALIEPLTCVARTAPVWQSFELEQQIATPDGDTRWVRLRARRFGADGTGGVLGIATDVTERRATSQALADLADRYWLVSELSPDGVAVHEAGRVTYANAAIARFLGLKSSTELLDQPITNFLMPESVRLLRRRSARLTARDATTQPMEATLIRADGGRLDVELVSVRTTWEGRPAFQMIMRDLTAQKAAEATLRHQAALVAHISDAVIATDASGRVTSWNPGAEVVYARPATTAVGRPVSELVGTPLDPMAVIRAGGVAHRTHRRSDGTPVEIRVSAAQMGDGFVLVCADETARRQAEQRFSSVVASLDEGIVIIGPTGVVESANPAACHVMGLSAGEIVGSQSLDWPLYDETGARVPPLELPTARARSTGQPQPQQVLRAIRPGGESVWLSVSCRPLHTESGPPHAVVLSFADITERKAIGERLEYEATHDPLTWLANRSLLVARLATALKARARGVATAVLFIDLDKFKVINDSLGHSVGDQVLRVVARRLRHEVRRGDLVGRLGGDEFAVVVTGVADPAALRALSGHLRVCLAEPITIDGRQLHVSASIGIVVAGPDDQRTVDDLLRDADVAMYHAKTLGRGRYEFFDVALRARLQRRMNLVHELREAVDDGHLWLAYQPIVEIRNNQVVGVEALLRWSSPRHGAVSPSEFIPLAEESDLSNLIGAFTLRTASTEISAWRAERGLDIGLAVNLSTRQLDDTQLVMSVDRTLRETGLPAHRLCLEITESALMDDPAVVHRKLTALSESGVRLAVDDFGTGYSSLTQIRRLPVDAVKIDRSLVGELVASPDARAITAGLSTMAHAIGLTVIAEGVEHAAQLDVLGELGCDQAQGGHLGPPVPALDLLPRPATSR